MSSGQEVTGTGKKAVNGTFKSTATAPDTSSWLQSFGRVSPLTDESLDWTLTGWGKAIVFSDGRTLQCRGKAKVHRATFYLLTPTSTTTHSGFLGILLLFLLSMLTLLSTPLSKQSSHR